MGRNCNYVTRASDLKELMIKAIIHEIISHNIEWNNINQNIEEMKLEAAITQN